EEALLVGAGVRGVRQRRGLARRVAPRRAPVLRAVRDLAHGRRIQPRAEGRLARVAEAVEVLQHVAADGLHQVAGRLARPQLGAAAQPDVGAEFGHVALEQRLHRAPVAARRGVDEGALVLWCGGSHGVTSYPAPRSRAWPAAPPRLDWACERQEAVG